MKDEPLFLQCIFCLNTYQKVCLVFVILMRIQRCKLYFASKNRFKPQNIEQKAIEVNFIHPEN